MRALGRRTLLLLLLLAAISVAWLWRAGSVLVALRQSSEELEILAVRAAGMATEDLVSREELRARIAQLRSQAASTTGPGEARTEAQMIAQVRDRARRAAPSEILEELFQANGVVRISERSWLPISLALRLPPERIAETIWTIEESDAGLVVDTVRMSGRTPATGSTRATVALALNIRAPMPRDSNTEVRR